MIGAVSGAVGGAPTPPRETRETLVAFQTLLLGIKDIGRRAAAGTLAPGGGPEQEAERAQAELRQLLIELGAPPTPPARLDAERIDRGYVLAAYADEALLHLVDWRGASACPGRLLEHALYNRRIAGEWIFDAADVLARRRDAGRRDVAAAIFLALSVGFRGRTRGSADDGALDRTRAQMFDLALGRQAPARLELPSRFRQAATYTATGRRAPLSRPVQRWSAAIAGIALGYLVISQIVWSSGASDLDAVAGRIIAAHDAGAADGVR